MGKAEGMRRASFLLFCVLTIHQGLTCGAQGTAQATTAGPPVIDFSKVDGKEGAQAQSEIGSGLQEWGMVQLANSIPVELLQRLKTTKNAAANEFTELLKKLMEGRKLTREQRRRFNEHLGVEIFLKREEYHLGFTQAEEHEDAEHPAEDPREENADPRVAAAKSALDKLLEYMNAKNLTYVTEDKVALDLANDWMDKMANASESPIRAYEHAKADFGRELQKVADKMLAVIERHLGVKEGHMKEKFEASHNYNASFVTWEYPWATLPLHGGALIMLFQDGSFSGVQVQKDGKWIDVRPVENAVIVIVGAQMQWLTDSQYMTRQYRVQNIDHFNRVYMTMFRNPDRVPIAPTTFGTLVLFADKPTEQHFMKVGNRSVEVRGSVTLP